MHVEFSATVTGPPRRLPAARAHAGHEAFEVRARGGRDVEVVANLNFTPWVAVRPGDRVVVGGELVHGRDGTPLVHWTHHDPAGRHEPGFIDWNGRRYA